MIEIVGEIGREPTKEELDAYMREKEAFAKSEAAGDRCHNCFGASNNDCQKCQEGRKYDENKTCKTCVNNDYGICDIYGLPVQDDDTCEKHRLDWREELQKCFTNDSRR